MAREYGARAVAVEALAKLLDQAMAQHQVNPGEPFLAANAYFDTRNPKDAIGNWVVGSALESLELNGYFSSFYSGPSARQRLEMIRNLGFGSPEMARRLSLVERRFFAAGKRG